jgi:multiple sugar transport system substrate-binding protein
LLFGYVTYARPSYAPHSCRVGHIPAPAQGAKPHGSILGGAGLAISVSCSAVPQACAYAQWVAGRDCQRTIYVEAGGQPGHRRAWLDPAVNAATNISFLDTLETLDTAYVRPRYAGFVPFQDKAGQVVHAYLEGQATEQRTLDTLDALYVESRTTERG